MNTVEAFQHWFRTSGPGARTSYYRGHLALERFRLPPDLLALMNYIRAAGTPKSSYVLKPHDRGDLRTPKAALAEMRGMGLGRLFQRRNGPDDYTYIFEKA